MKRFLIIQTAFIGDVILATPIIEKLHHLFPDSKIDFLLRKGNEELLTDHPKLNKVFIWNKRKNKYFNLLKVLFQVRRKPYHMVINVHRFPTSGMITYLTKAREKTGFDKNPFAFCYTHKISHEIGNGLHEVQRNLQLIETLGAGDDFKPRLYFSESDQRRVNDLVTGEYVTMAPSSVWFTKQMPKEKWAELIRQMPDNVSVCLIGSGNDVSYCQDIIGMSERENIFNFSGKLRLLESAALMNP